MNDMMDMDVDDDKIDMNTFVDQEVPPAVDKAPPVKRKYELRNDGIEDDIALLCEQDLD